MGWKHPAVASAQWASPQNEGQRGQTIPSGFTIYFHAWRLDRLDVFHPFCAKHTLFQGCAFSFPEGFLFSGEADFHVCTRLHLRRGASCTLINHADVQERAAPHRHKSMTNQRLSLKAALTTFIWSLPECDWRGNSVQAETQGPFHWKTFEGTMVSVVSVGEEAHLESTLLKSSPEYKHSCCSVGGKRVCSFSVTSRETSPTDVGTSRWMKLESIVKISNHLLIRLHPQLQAEATLVKLWNRVGNSFVTA